MIGRANSLDFNAPMQAQDLSALDTIVICIVSTFVMLSRTCVIGQRERR